MSHANLFPLPLVPLEEYLLLDDSPEYPMTFYVELRVEGTVDVAAFRAAVNSAVARHPLLGAQAIWQRGRAYWIYADPPRPQIIWSTPTKPAPLGGWIDLQNQLGLRVWVHQEDHHAAIVLQFHHACCDGKGARRFVADLLIAYAQATVPTSPAPSEDLLEPQRLRSRGDFSASVVAEPRSFVSKLREAWGFHVLKPSPLVPGKMAAQIPFASPPLIVRTTFARAETGELRRLARQSNIRINDLAVALLFQTLAGWNREMGDAHGRQRLRILMPTNLRTPEDRTLPAANRTGFSFLTRQIDQCESWPTLVAGVVEENRRIQRARLGLDFIHGVALARRVPKLLPTLIKLSGCLTTAVLTNLGDLGRRFDRLFPSQDGMPVVGNLLLREVGGVPPIRPGTRLGLGLCWLGGRLTISAQCDPRYFDSDVAQTLLNRYEAAWRTWAELTSTPSLPQSSAAYDLQRS